MTTDNKNRLNEILGKIENLNKAYGLHNSSILRGIAVEKEGTWYNTVSTLNIASKGLDEVEKKVEELEPGQIIAFRLPMNIKDTTKLLKTMEKSNRFKVFDTRIEISLRDDKEPRWDRREEIGTYQAIHKYPFKCGVVEYFIDSQYSVGEIRDMREAIKKHGYHNHHEMIADRVFWDTGRSIHRQSMAERSGVHLFILHHHLSIQSVEYDDEKIDIAIDGLLPDEALSDFFLTTRVHTDFNVMLSPVKTDPLTERRISINLPSQRYSVEAELWWKRGKTHAEDFVDRFYGERKLGNGNARVVSYLQFDPDLKILEKEMSPRQKNSKNFEWGVSTLLHLAGFDTSWLGYPGKLMEGEIDVLGFAPEISKVLAVECTVKSGDIAKKVADLHRKIGVLESTLKKWEIVTAVFTNLDSEGLAHQAREAARNQGAFLVAWDGILQLLSLVKKGTPVKLILQKMSEMNAAEFIFS